MRSLVPAILGVGKTPRSRRTGQPLRGLRVEIPTQAGSSFFSHFPRFCYGYQLMGMTMRIACVVVALLGLSACTDDDQRYLLTYDHSKAVSPVLSANAAPQFVRDAAPVSQTEAGPAAAPTQSVAVAPEAIIGAPAPAERPKQDFGAISTAEI